MMRKNLNLLTTHYSLQTKSGFSLLEMLFVIGIMAILFLIGTKIFSNSSPKYKVDNAVVIVLNLLNEAKSMTSSAVGSSQYGVHFETTTLTLFKGETFSAVDPNNRELVTTYVLGHSVLVYKNKKITGKYRPAYCRG